jgi:hypothetical protein
MAVKSLSVRKKSQTSAWLRSTSSTKKATKHPQWCSLLATVAADVMAVEVVMVVEDVTLVAAEVAATAAAAMVAMVAATVAVAAAASALGLGLAAAVAVAAVATMGEATGAGLMACGRGVLATITAIRPAKSLSL